MIAQPTRARAAPASPPTAAGKASPAPARAPQKVWVMAVHTTGIEKGVGSTLTDVLTSEVASVSHLQVIGANDIKSLLGFQAQKQLLGCSDHASCLAQIGGALGVDLLVVAEVGRVGDGPGEATTLVASTGGGASAGDYRATLDATATPPAAGKTYDSDQVSAPYEKGRASAENAGDCYLVGGGQAAGGVTAVVWHTVR